MPDELTTIGIIGPPYAGKTTYLKELKRALENEGWIVDADASALKSAEEEGSNHLLQDSPDYLFPPKTLPNRSDPNWIGSSTCTYRMNHPLSGQSVQFEFLDPPGEVFTGDDRGYPDMAEARKEIFEKMRTWKGGIVVILDLVRPADDLSRFWINSVNWYRNKQQKTDGDEKSEGANNETESQTGPLTLPIAVVFTKMDQIPHFVRYRQGDAESWMHYNPDYKELYCDIQRNCKRVKFFFASATGWVDGMQNVRTQVIPYTVADFEEDKKETTADEQESASDGRKLLGPAVPDPAVSDDPEKQRLPSPAKHPIAHPPKNVHVSPARQLFDDPLRIAAAELSEEDRRRLGNPHGVLECPRRENKPGRYLPIQPWNVAEPLLWVVAAIRSGTPSSGNVQ